MLDSVAAKVIVGAVAGLSALRFGTGIYFWRQTEALERPSYTVLEKLHNGVEIRRYEPYLIAETTVDGVGLREPARAGFRACAGYIFGKNKPRNQNWFSTREVEPEKMAMTAPVRVSGEVPSDLKNRDGEIMFRDGGAQSKKKTKVSFVIGNKYSLKTVPKPIDNSVKVRQIPAHTLAVRKFSGSPPKDARVQKEREKIEEALRKAGRKVPHPDENVLVYGYHDPFITPNFLRRNEVALVMEGAA